MIGVDRWLDNDSKIIFLAPSGMRYADIQQRIAAEPTQEVLVAAHRDIWHAVLCAAVAALVAFAAMDCVATSLVIESAPS